MAEYDLGATHTLLEVANRTNNKQLLEITRNLEPINDWVATARWRLANRLDSEKLVRQQSTLSPGMGGINKDISPTVEQTVPVTEPIVFVEDRNELDANLVEMQQNPQMYRMQSDMTHTAFVAAKAVSQFFYGDRADDPDQLNGIIKRTDYDALADTNYVTTAGDSSAGAVTSAYLVQWGFDKVYMVYPENGGQTVKVENMGKQLITGTAPARSWKYVTNFKMFFGLAVANPRCIHRICNIGTTTANFLPLEYIIRARGKMPNYGAGAVLYCHPRVRAQIDEQIATRPNIVHRVENPIGPPITYIDDIRVATCESILLTETVVS